jgi:hypothetical protein
MRRTIAAGLVATTALATPAGVFAAERPVTRASVAGGISGVVRNAAGTYVVNGGVRIRSASDGRIVTVTQTSTTGAFFTSSIQPGYYVVEALNAAGQVIGESAVIPVGSGVTAYANVTAGGSTPTLNNFSVFGLSKSASVGLLAVLIGGGATAAVLLATSNTTTVASPSQ